MARYDETRNCMVCGTPFEAYNINNKFCSMPCQNKHFNIKAHRLSLKLTPEQREVILALEQYFIKNWKFDYKK